MRHVNKTARKVLDTLTAGLTAGSGRKIDNARGAYMAVHVDALGPFADYGPSYSVAHFYEQEGDLMADPDMVFVHGQDGEWYPISYRQDGLGIDQISARNEGGRVLVSPRLQADHAVFAGQWMRNVGQQQGLFARSR